ncbi:TIGR04222 domain-containing membrane protein [Streptomyces sp. ME01-18a]|uniref:TIGR04222 domain-containing membrane protein n=1 Tax=Streptomyces sp. ME01-18a TaxID=3028669 RepID=UPI0029AE26EB|nr:TIGR04222 domain-containing membrane protein [Streptomyces sp. ME01-18a]MDX3430883.1 TIGR04222 domain-containing membrane protein [Streptomyces sp. ME01-18a]
MLWVLLLLVAWGAAAVSCIRLCLVTAGAAPLPSGAARAPVSPELNLYETAFLAGGPQRVADLALVSMHLRRRLLLARTGWATVVDPEGRDEVERTVIRAIGPEGQSRIAPIRAAAAAADAVRSLADRLVAAGLALPHGARTDLESAARAVRGAAVLVVVLAATAMLMPGQETGYAGPVAAWFGLPLVLTLGCLAIARVENHPYSPWASPSGQRWLDSLPAPVRGADRDLLAAVAVRGVGAVEDPDLRAALLSGARTAG